jgi:hypothetical protein
MVVKKNTKFWIGYEEEGKYKNIKTLFIRGDQLIPKIEEILSTNIIHHIYFGAGNQSKIKNYKTISYFAAQDFLITLEVNEENLKDVPKEILINNNIYIVVTFKNKYISKNLGYTDAIKIEDDNHVWISTLECMSHTNKKYAYQGDRVIK